MIEGLRGDTDKRTKALVRKALKSEFQVIRRAAIVVAISVLEKEGTKLLRRIAAKDPDHLVKTLAKETLKKEKAAK